MTSAVMEIEYSFSHEPLDPRRLAEVQREGFLGDGNEAGTESSVLLALRPGCFPLRSLFQSNLVGLSHLRCCDVKDLSVCYGV